MSNVMGALIYMATSCGTSSLRSQHLIHIVTGMPHAMYSLLAMLCWEPDAFNSAKMSEAYMNKKIMPQLTLLMACHLCKTKPWSWPELILSIIP